MGILVGGRDGQATNHFVIVTALIDGTKVDKANLVGKVPDRAAAGPNQRRVMPHHTTKHVACCST